MKLDRDCVCIACEDPNCAIEFSGRKPDYVIAARGDLAIDWYVLELKTGGIRASELLEQLQAAVDRLEQLPEHLRPGDSLTAAVVHARVRGADLAVLDRKKLTVRGKRVGVVRRLCGVALSELDQRSQAGS